MHEALAEPRVLCASPLPTEMPPPPPLPPSPRTWRAPDGRSQPCTAWQGFTGVSQAKRPRVPHRSAVHRGCAGSSFQKASKGNEPFPRERAPGKHRWLGGLQRARPDMLCPRVPHPAPWPSKRCGASQQGARCGGVLRTPALRELLGQAGSTRVERRWKAPGVLQHRDAGVRPTPPRWGHGAIWEAQTVRPRSKRHMSSWLRPSIVTSCTRRPTASPEGLKNTTSLSSCPATPRLFQIKPPLPPPRPFGQSRSAAAPASVRCDPPGCPSAGGDFPKSPVHFSN